MTDGNRLEELRSKIIASMGDKASQTGAKESTPQRYGGGPQYTRRDPHRRPENMADNGSNRHWRGQPYRQQQQFKRDNMESVSTRNQNVGYPKAQPSSQYRPHTNSSHTEDNDGTRSDEMSSRQSADRRATNYQNIHTRETYGGRYNRQLGNLTDDRRHPPREMEDSGFKYHRNDGRSRAYYTRRNNQQENNNNNSNDSNDDSSNRSNDYSNNNRYRQYHHGSFNKEPKWGRPDSANKASHYKRPSARDLKVFENLAASRVNSILVVSQLNLPTDNDISRFQNTTRRFCTNIDGKNFTVTKFTFGVNKQSIVIEFNTAECATWVLSCSSFLKRELGQVNSQWSRPNGYIAQRDNPNIFCRDNVLALTEVPALLSTSGGQTEGSSSGDYNYKEKMQQFLNELEISEEECTAEVLTLRSSQGQPKETEEGKEREEEEEEGEESKENIVSTGCILLSPKPGKEQQILDKLPKTLNWSFPNRVPTSTLTQETKSMVFFNMPNRAREMKLAESRVLLLMNCADPMDLKDLEFVAEIESSLRLHLGPKVKSLKLCKPSADYRLTFDYVKEHAGNVYVEFEDVESARAAMDRVAGSKFNGRTVLCSYVDERDYHIPGVIV